MKIHSYFLRMGLTALVMIALGVVFAPSLLAIFNTNPRLNALIVALTLCGIGFSFYQLVKLVRDVRVLEALKQGNNFSLERTTFLEPILSFVSQKKTSLDPSLAKGLADSLADRLDNERVIPRYLIGLLVFLGLLGTFWGLSQTIGSIAQLIQNMPSDTTSAANFVGLLKESLQEPLKGMGTAFSSSLFGLGGSLLVGLLELQVGHAYGRFLNETDLYLTASSHKALSSPAPASYLQALLTQNVESIDELTQILQKTEKNERQTAYLLDQLLMSLTHMVDQNKIQQQLMLKFVEGQREDRDLLLKKLQDELRLIARTMATVSETQRRVG